MDPAYICLSFGNLGKIKVLRHMLFVDLCCGYLGHVEIVRGLCGVGCAIVPTLSPTTYEIGMPNAKLTAAFIESATATPGAKKTTYWDDALPGFSA